MRLNERLALEKSISDDRDSIISKNDPQIWDLAHSSIVTDRYNSERNAH